MLRVYCQRVLRLGADQRAIVANGRILGPLEDDELFVEEDFGLFERYSSVQYLDKIVEAVSKESDYSKGIFTYISYEKQFNLPTSFQI